MMDWISPKRRSPDLYFAVVTGCLRISKESIFTGLNNLKVDTISDERYDEYFGFLDADVRKILEDYGLTSAYHEMKEWYDGYRFGGAELLDLSLYNTYDGNLELLEKPIGGRNIDQFVRAAMLDVMGQLYLDGTLTENEWKAFLKQSL